MKIGFIGAGNMASAIIGGVIGSGLIPPCDIYAYDILGEKLNSLAQKTKINPCVSEEEAINNCGAVVLAVKPNVFHELLPRLGKSFEKNGSLIISIAAGKNIDFIGGLLGYEAKIARIMPNINATVGEAISAYCVNGLVSEKETEFIDAFCRSFGRSISLPEDKFPIFGVLGGCAPAYAYMFIDSLARAGVKNGMSKQEALEIAAQTVLGSAKQILESGLHPWELIDRVCSPGGTTIEGITALQEKGFESAVQRAVDASFEKDKRL